MKTIDYFKLQAKNLFKDFKTQKPVFDEGINDYLNQYTPKYFDIDKIVLDFDIDEDKFSLMNAQHIIANLAGFEKWGTILKSSSKELELSKMLFDNQHMVDVVSWSDYIAYAEEMNQVKFNTETKLEIFKEAVFVRRVFDGEVPGYLLKNEDYINL